jgi:hypothetical protein
MISLDYTRIAAAHPKLERGQARCRLCGRTQYARPAECLQYGWPKCCGCTMTIDSPAEQQEPTK